MTLSGTTFNCNITDTNTVTSLRLDNAGTYRTGNINLVGGTNVTISETSAGVFSFASTDTNTDTNTVTRVRETNTTYRSGDLTLVGGTNVTISETSAGVFNFASTDTNTDTNTTYTAGTNMSLSGTEFSATDTNTTYSAGAGLDLSGTTFSIEADVREHANARFGNNAMDFILFDSDNDLLRFYINDNEKAQIDAAGKLDVLNDIIAYSTSVSSDEKLKDNIEIIPSALDKLSQVKGVTFNWKKDGKASAGVIAQDVEKVLPSAVSEHKKLNSDEVYKNVDYNQVIGLLVESIKELKSELDDLKSSNS
jgi:hypothetical protein